MNAYYTELLLIHVGAVMLSGSLFFMRGFAKIVLRQSWPMVAPVRYLTYAVDTVLLAAAVMLTFIIRQYPFHDGWLTMKLGLLVVYIVLGTIALKRGKSEKQRLYAWIAALAVFLFIITVARAHNPLGLFAPAFGLF